MLARSPLPFALSAFLAAVPFAHGLAAQQPPQGQLDASPSLFAILAAVNAAGYDAEIDSPTNNPLRAQIRKALSSKNLPSIQRLKKHFEARRQWNWNSELSQYISYALSVDGPPTFKPRYSPAQMPPDTLILESMGPILADFWREADLDALWRASQPAYDQAIAEYHAPVSQAILESNLYLRNPTSGMSGRRFQVFVDLLASPNQVHTRSFGDDYFVVVTPSVRPRVTDIRHAYLHYLLDPLIIRYRKNLDAKRGLGDLALGSPILAEAYKEDFSLLASMCLVKAVEARLDRSLGPPSVEQSMREGFILTAYFYEALGAYEKQEQALRLHLPAMIDAIDLAKEDKRIAQVEFASSRSTRVVRPAAPIQPALSDAEKAFDAAERLYTQRNLPAARQGYMKILEMAAPKPIQAKAWFGLARIAFIEKDPERAQQLFEKTLESEPEDFERAWAHVYLARLARLAQEPDGARKQYQAALAVKGASDGAKKAAEQELSQLAAARNP
jgi:tetratricopeptide (TPR) repeat protein